MLTLFGAKVSHEQKHTLILWITLGITTLYSADMIVAKFTSPLPSQ